MEQTVEKRTKNRLWILFVASRADIRLTEEQLWSIISEHDIMGYFDFKIMFLDLVKAGLISENPSPNGMFYRITQSGKDTIEFELKQLSYTKRTAVEHYLDVNRQRFEQEGMIYAYYYEIPDGGYRVTMRLQEQEMTVFEVRYISSTESEAKLLTKNWHKNHMKVYHSVFAALLDSPPPDEGI